MAHRADHISIPIYAIQAQLDIMSQGQNVLVGAIYIIN